MIKDIIIIIRYWENYFASGEHNGLDTYTGALYCSNSRKIIQHNMKLRKKIISAPTVGYSPASRRRRVKSLGVRHNIILPKYT